MAIKKGLYGDALYYLKELYWYNWIFRERLTNISGLLSKVYIALNREEYATIIDDYLVNFDD